jgi:hypothetical protein
LLLDSRRAPPATAQVLSFSILIGVGSNAVVLCHDNSWSEALEKTPDLAQLLSLGQPFSAAGRQIHTTGVARYAGKRSQFFCIGISS